MRLAAHVHARAAGIGSALSKLTGEDWGERSGPAEGTPGPDAQQGGHQQPGRRPAAASSLPHRRQRPAWCAHRHRCDALVRCLYSQVRSTCSSLTAASCLVRPSSRSSKLPCAIRGGGSCSRAKTQCEEVRMASTGPSCWAVIGGAPGTCAVRLCESSLASDLTAPFHSHQTNLSPEHLAQCGCMTGAWRAGRAAARRRPGARRSWPATCPPT